MEGFTQLAISSTANYGSVNSIMRFSDKILQFITGLEFPILLPTGIEVMNPFLDPVTLNLCKAFYNKFYCDSQRRWMIIGINPGRFGGGITGIPFTDPIRLSKDCAIDNPWKHKQELSSLFIYDMIRAFGGPEAFYRHFYLTAVSPLGFTRDNKNVNYYDDKQLKDNIKAFVIECFEKQFEFGIHRKIAFCLGDGKNYHFLRKINDERHLFDSIIPLPHPRFIMQYRLKKKEQYIESYLEAFHSVLK